MTLSHWRYRSCSLISVADASAERAARHVCRHKRLVTSRPRTQTQTPEVHATAVRESPSGGRPLCRATRVPPGAGHADPGGGWVPRVLVVDDEEDIRLLLREVIEAAVRDLNVVGQAATGEEAIERCRQTNPDVILLDQRMPGMTGLEAAERILRERPDQLIVLFSAFLEDSTVRKASELGIRACLPKGDFSRVPEALWKVASA
jgi:CheY-like chemotaxis protein